MPDNFMPTSAEMLRFLPELILILMGTLIMVLEPLTSRENKDRLGIIALIALAGAAWGTSVAHSNPGPAFQAMLLVDGFATFFRYLTIGVGFFTILASFSYLRRENADSGEYYALTLFSIVGQCVMVSANELIMIFIGLEISSIATYIMAGYLRDDKRNNESALKYFLLGSFATAFLLYGIAWIYGITGQTNLAEIRRVLSVAEGAPSNSLLGLAAALMFVGFAFKISAVPFQAWAPDVYQGAPAPVSGFMSAGPKAAAFAVFLRVFTSAFEPIAEQWQAVVIVSAIATMCVGNFAALVQPNIKRLLAYSSIAHAGYVMVAIAAHSEIGTTAVMFYMAAYAFMNVGAFAVISHFSRQGEKYVTTDDMAGLGLRQPVTAALLTIFLLSLIGVPLTGGFFGKFYIFKAALDANLVWVTIIGLLNSAVAAYYYLRIIVVMYFRDPADSTRDLPPLAPGIQAVLWGAAVATLILGIYPSIVLDFAGRSANLLK
jgi:NADH-quinone oxidoreductase subunit N